MAETVFDLILSKQIPSWPVWEDEKHLAFLTPFPNTPGLTVVIPKINHGDYAFSLPDAVLTDLVLAAKKVAQKLEKAFNTSRVAMVFEGTGVAHVHAKLYPLHGDLAAQTDVWVKRAEFYPEYLGYITTTEGPKMDDAELTKIQERIRNA